MTGTRPRRAARAEYLLATWEGGGSAPPVIGLGRSLAERGHGVRVMADPVLGPEVEAAGCEFVPWKRAPHRVDRDPANDLVRDYEARTPLGGFARLRDGIVTGAAAAIAADVAEELGRRPADVVAPEMVLIGALIAAEAAGSPSAALLTTVNLLPQEGVPPFGPGLEPARGPLGRLRDRLLAALNERMWDRGLGDLNEARAAHGLPPLDHTMDQLTGADRILVLTSAAFDPPVDGLADNVRIVGPRLDDPSWAGAWEPPAGDGPLVLISLSSSFQDQGKALQRAADAVGGLPARGLLTTGPAVDPGSIRAPAGVTVVESAPHGEVLRQAAAVVTHGGHGTVIKALAAGVPPVVIPMGRDQLEVGARVARAGAGVRLRPGASARAIRAAVAKVLGDPSYREAAARLAREIAAETAEDRAVAELEGLAARSRAATA